MGKIDVVPPAKILLILGALSIWLSTKPFQHEKIQRPTASYEENYNLVRQAPLNPLNIEKTIDLGLDQRLAHVYHLYDSLSGLATIGHENEFLSWLPGGSISGRDSDDRAPGEYLDWFRFDSLNADQNSKQLLVQYANSGTAGVHPFYLYSYDGNNFELLLKLVAPYSKTEIKDLDGDGIKEIVHTFSLDGSGLVERTLLRWKDIYKIGQQGVHKVNNLFPDSYRELHDFHRAVLNNQEWGPDAEYYYPTLRCLLEQAQSNIANTFADAKPCYKHLKKESYAEDVWNLYQQGKDPYGHETLF